jgi:hypothetical protein
MASVSATPKDAAAITPIDDDLMVLLKEELSTDEQQLFAQSFRAYLAHDAKKDFVVDLDDVYEWIGFQRQCQSRHSETTRGGCALPDFASATSKAKLPH